MKKIALLFSGQGAQVVGMGRDLADQFPAIRALYDEADQTLGFSLSQISFQGPESDLTQTKVCQPALYVHGLALLQIVKAETPTLDFSATAGLSLGEYTAHAAAGSFDFSTGLNLVYHRGRLMQEACETTSGGMLTLIGASTEQARAVAAAVDIDVANLNCPGQIVLSGAKDKIPAAVSAAQQLGIKRAIPLNVAGAYHSRLMSGAQTALEPYLQQATLQNPRLTVFANVTGQAVSEPAAIREALARQVSSSVRWEECVRGLIAQGYSTFLELGPGGVLAGLLRRIDSAAKCISVSTYQEWKDKQHELSQ